MLAKNKGGSLERKEWALGEEGKERNGMKGRGVFRAEGVSVRGGGEGGVTQRGLELGEFTKEMDEASGGVCGGGGRLTRRMRMAGEK